MRKLLILFAVVLIGFTTTLSLKAKQTDIIIKNKFFSISLPDDLRNLYGTKIKKDSISVYHKESKKAGFGGFAFGIKAYKNPADHAEMPGGRKLGELMSKDGETYDIVLKQPTDVQYDYTKGVNSSPSYKRLYDLGENVEIKGERGNFYFKNKGMKGVYLYGEILRKHKTALDEKWDSAKLEKENMSPMYNVVEASGRSTLDKIGYIYYDVNGDGIEELLIGEIADGARKGVVYDMYTMVNRKPQHVVSGVSRNRYFICNGTFVCNDYSGGANESGTRVYILIENSTELFPQVSFKYDAYENPKNPWFLSYGENRWENVSEEKYNERIKVFKKYNRFNFIPFKSVK